MKEYILYLVVHRIKCRYIKTNDKYHAGNTLLKIKNTHDNNIKPALIINNCLLSKAIFYQFSSFVSLLILRKTII